MFSKPVKILKGNIFTKSVSQHYSKQCSQKTITFDLDETLGDFGDLYILWKEIEHLIPIPHRETVFRELLDLFPEFLRPGILPILEFLLHKKQIGICSHVFLYTNNQCPKEWTHRIIQYFSERTPNLFDQIICAFKINNQRIEPLRTTHSKTYSDLIRCTLLPKHSEVCFVDNTFHPKMVNERVYYIQPKSYKHGLSHTEMIHRFVTKWTSTPVPDNIEKNLQDTFARYMSTMEMSKKGGCSQLESIHVSQKIMYHLKEYFLLYTKMPKTKKILLGLGRFTRKKRVS